MDNIFLYLFGFAGTDKLTIAQAFARYVGAKVVDNHWINNPIWASSIRTVCRRCRMRSGARPPRYARPCSKRSRRWQSLARTSYSRTMASKVSPTTKTCARHPITPARRGARLIPVRLARDEDELIRRIQSADRDPMLKSTNPAEAIHRSRHHAVLDPRLPGTLTLDVTRLTPEQSVEAIVVPIKGLVS